MLIYWSLDSCWLYTLVKSHQPKVKIYRNIQEWVISDLFFVFSDTPILVWFWTYSWIVSELFLIIFWIISGPLPCDLDVPSDVIPRSCFLVVLTVIHAAMFQNVEKVEVVSKISSFFRNMLFFETNRINLVFQFFLFFSSFFYFCVSGACLNQK